MTNSIETTIAIAFLGSIAIAIVQVIFLLVGKLLLLLTGLPTIAIGSIDTEFFRLL